MACIKQKVFVIVVDDTMQPKYSIRNRFYTKTVFCTIVKV